MFRARMGLMMMCMMLFKCATSQTDTSKIKLKFKPQDTLRYYASKRNGRFLIGLDGRKSYINGASSQVVGIRYGLGYDKVSLYAGFYSSNYFKGSKLDTTSVNYAYIATTVEYYLKDEWRYDIYIPVAIGIGNKTNSTYNVVTKETISKTENFVPMELGLGGSVRFLRYLGLVGSMGYRWSIYKGSGYAAPFWSLGFTVYTGTLWRDTKRNVKKLIKN